MRKRITLFLAIALVITSALPLSAPVTQAAPKKIKLNIRRLNLTVGTNYQLRVYNLNKKQKVTFSSSNPEVISLQENPQFKKKVTVKAIAIGSSKITATVKQGKKVRKILKCKVKVSPNAVSIKFLKRQAEVSVGQRLRLDTIIKPNTSLEQPVFESDNPDIATVNCRGIVTAISPGTVTITATLLSSNITARCQVKVLPESSDEAALPKDLDDIPIH